MEHTKQLEGFTTRELVEELRRRIAELDEARALLSGAGQASTPKNLKISSAKSEYWRAWHQYRAVHPSASVAEWRKSLKSPKRKT